MGGHDQVYRGVQQGDGRSRPPNRAALATLANRYTVSLGVSERTNCFLEGLRSSKKSAQLNI